MHIRVMGSMHSCFCFMFVAHGPTGRKGTKRGPVGLFVPKRDAPKRMSREDIRMNQNWKMVNSARIGEALDFYDNDKFVQDAVVMKLNHILGGGVHFRRKNHRQTGEAARWHSRVYIKIMEDLYRYGLAVGFAGWAVAPHDKYVGEPILIDLLSVDIYMLRDLWGRTALKFFPKEENSPLGQGETQYEIEGITVIEWKMPDANGSIRSISDVLKPDADIEADLEMFMVRACKFKCFPPVITQKMTQQSDVQPMFSAHSIVAQDSDQGRSNQLMQYARTAQEAQARTAMRNHNGAQATARDIENLRTKSGAHLLVYSNQVYLEDDRTVARSEPAQEPLRYIEFSQKRRDDVFAYFSIPPGVVSAGGSAGHRTGNSGSSANSMVVFINDQKQLKNRFLSITQDMFKAATYDVQALELVLDAAAKKKRRTTQDMKEELETDVEMPGIPEDRVLYDLYMLGALKYEALCTVLGDKHGMAPWVWNPTPALDVKLLNGIKPEPPKSHTDGR